MVEVLDLSWNQLIHRGALAIGASIKENGSIRKLNIGWNGFDDAAAKVLGDSLKSNHSLSELDLSNNHILAAGCQAIAAGIAAGGHMEVIHLGLNNVGVDGVKALVDTARKSPFLKLIDLRKVPTDEDTHKQIKALVTPSEQLTQLTANKVGGASGERERESE